MKKQAKRAAKLQEAVILAGIGAGVTGKEEPNYLLAPYNVSYEKMLTREATAARSENDKGSLKIGVQGHSLSAPAKINGAL